MKNLAQTLEALKPSFIEALDSHLFIYTTIGSGTHESPMWLQMDQIANGRLRFSNSQNTSIGFSIDLSHEEQQQLIRDYRDESYDYFKYVKYTHIREIAPTVWNELAVGFNGSRINSFMQSYQPPVIEIKSRIEQLMESGQLTVEEVMEYAQKHMDAVDQYDDIEQYFDQYNMEYEQAEHERMMYSQDMYGQEEQDMYGNDMPQHIRSSNPEYIIASTSFRAEETYVFEATSDGKLLDSGEYGGLAKRWGVNDWQNHQLAVREAMDNPYRFEREIQTGSDKVRYFLYSRIGSADYWDGEQY